MPGFDVHRGLSPEVEAVVDGIAFSETLRVDWIDNSQHPDLQHYNVVRLSQSFINSWLKCPRSAVFDAQNPSFGEAAAAGIVAHEITDARIKVGGSFDDTDYEALLRGMEQLRTEDGIAHSGDAFMADVWHKAEVLERIYLDTYRRYEPHIETEASGEIVYDVRHLPGLVDFIVITGTADLIYEFGGRVVGVDWKTGKKMPAPWTVQRYGVQWRIYAVMFDLDEMIFEYPIAFASGDYEANRFGGRVKCEADEATRRAFRAQILDQCIPIAEALFSSERHEDHTPMPTDWHCSAKWCQVFARSECVGATPEVAWIDKSHKEAAKAATNK